MSFGIVVCRVCARRERREDVIWHCCLPGVRQEGMGTFFDRDLGILVCGRGFATQRASLTLCPLLLLYTKLQRQLLVHANPAICN